MGEGMTHGGPGLLTRAVTSILALVVLAALVTLVVAANRGALFAAGSPQTPAEGCDGGCPAGSPAAAPVGHERPSLEPSAERVAPLPIQVDVETGAMLQERAQAEGRERVMEADPLSPWDRLMLGRFLAIDDLVIRHADRFGLSPMWLLLVLSSESALDPVAQGDEPGDRGLGQVGYAAASTAMRWAADPDGPYHVSDFPMQGGVWEPEQNILLAAIVLRSFYAMPDVHSHEQAYARYTHGLAAVEDGEIARRSLARVERAAGYEEQMRLFFALSTLSIEDFDTLPPVLDDPLVREMLALDRETEDGLPMYRALQDLYVAEAREGEPSPWSFALAIQEALSYAGLIQRVEAEPVTQDLTVIRSALEARAPAISATGDRELTALLDRLVADVERLLATASPSDVAVDAVGSDAFNRRARAGVAQG